MLSYDYGPMAESKTYEGSTLYISNVYDVTDYNSTYDKIEKVLLYSSEIGAHYDIYIKYIDDQIPDVSAYLGDRLGFGTVDAEGYFTVTLDTPFTLDGLKNKIAIIVKYTTSNDKISVCQEDSQTTDKDKFNLYCKPGESYIYQENEWTDITGGTVSDTVGNYCIRPVLKRAVPIESNSTLSVNEVRYADEDISVDINLQGNKLYKITKNGSKLLYEDSDFYRDGTTITFKKSFLQGLSEASPDSATNIVFSFTTGEDQILKINPRAKVDDVYLEGKQAIGQTLDISFNGNADYEEYNVSCQWQRTTDDGLTWTDITEATQKQYTLTSDDFLNKVRIKVTDLNHDTVTYSGSSWRIVMYGDVDLDGRVSVKDVTLVQKYINGSSLEWEQRTAADVNGDRLIDETDVALIQEYLADGITSFPVENN